MEPRKVEMDTGFFSSCLLVGECKTSCEKTVSFPIDERGGLRFYGLNLFWLNSLTCFYVTLYSVPLNQNICEWTLKFI